MMPIMKPGGFWCHSGWKPVGWGLWTSGWVPGSLLEGHSSIFSSTGDAHDLDNNDNHDHNKSASLDFSALAEATFHFCTTTTIFSTAQHWTSATTSATTTATSPTTSPTTTATSWTSETTPAYSSAHSAPPSSSSASAAPSSATSKIAFSQIPSHFHDDSSDSPPPEKGGREHRDAAGQKGADWRDVGHSSGSGGAGRTQEGGDRGIRGRRVRRRRRNELGVVRRSETQEGKHCHLSCFSFTCLISFRIRSRATTVAPTPANRIAPMATHLLKVLLGSVLLEDLTGLFSRAGRFALVRVVEFSSSARHS